MNDITYYSDDSYQGEGISLGLARGILVKYKGIDIVQEGMGLGSLAIKNRLITYFASTCNTTQLSENQFRKTFLIDSTILWRINGRQSILITRIIDILAQCYMFLPGLQNKLLRTGTLFRNLFKLTPQIVKITPIAEACFNYSVQNNELFVEGRIKSLSGYLNKVFILNELGADYFQNGLKNGKIVSPPNGWNPTTSKSGSVAFFNPYNNLSFIIKKISNTGFTPFKVFWGREKTKDLCWAGFEIEFDCSNKKMECIDCEYIAKIKN
jgi:hypothetical protein